MKDEFRNEAWKAMRETFSSYRKTNKISMYVLMGFFVIFTIGFYCVLPTGEFLLNAMIFLTIGILLVGYLLSFDALTATLKDNKVIREKLIKKNEEL